MAKMQSVGALWLRSSDKIGDYYTGKMEDGTKVVAFIKKEGDKESAPDIKIYVSEDRSAPPKKSDDIPF